MRVIYSILNYGRMETKQTLMSLPEGAEVIICDDNTSSWKKDSPVYKRFSKLHYILEPKANVAKAKNLIMDKARELKAQYLFILEDDVIVKDDSVFEKYIDLMGKYDLGVTMYSFDKTNIAMGKPNPIMKIKLDEEGNELWVARQSCSSCMGFDLNRAPILKFDEKLQMAELDMFLKNASINKHIPFFGFYFDLPNSDKYFDRVDVPTARVITKKQMEADKKYISEVLKVTLKPDESLDSVIDYIRKKVGV